MDTEITALIGIHGPDKTRVKNPSFLAVGWDKKLHLWLDPAYREDQGEEEDGDGISCKDLPPAGAPLVHEHDIMSCTFDLKQLLIFTGGIDGTIIGWTYETKFPRYEMHKWDPTCQSDNHIRDSKSIDALIVMDEEDPDRKRLLLSMSADQILRFWDIDDLPSN